MGKYKTYEKYKPSGVDWLGEIPEHWQVQKLKYSSYLKGRIGWQNLRSDEFTDEDPYLITGMHFKDGSVDWDACYHITQERYNMAPEIHVREHDILITKDGSIGKLAYIDYLPGLASLNSHLLLIRPTQKQYLPRYLYYLLGSAAFEVHILNEQKGTTFYGISQHSIANFPAIFPSLEEQKSIARFLDRETTRIDTLITKKRQLIALLQKKRDALVDSFVIKVSDPYEAIKKAGMSWLNDLPDDWGNVRLKFLSSFITSSSRGWAEYYSDEGSVFLRIGNLSTESIDLDLTDLQFVQPPKGAEGERTRVYPNDLLISITALIGAVGVVPSKLSEAYVNQHTALVRLLNQHIHSRWAAYCVFSSLGQKQLGEFTSGGTKDGLTLSDVGNLLILIPPDKDQELYAKKIDKKLDSIQLTLLKTKESIRVLEKYRTALITAAVTGKIDVREVAET